MIKVKNKITFDKYSYLLQDLITNNDFDLYKIIPIVPHPLQTVRECELLQWGTTGVCKDSTVLDNNTVEFDTWWGPIIKIIFVLAQKYPDIIFTYSFVSNDIGSQAGIIKIKNSEILYGYIPTSFSADCYELSFKLWGEECKKDYIYDELKHTYRLKEE